MQERMWLPETQARSSAENIKAVARTGREKARQWAGPGSDSHCTIVTGHMGRRDWRRLDLGQVEQLRDRRLSC